MLKPLLGRILRPRHFLTSYPQFLLRLAQRNMPVKREFVLSEGMFPSSHFDFVSVIEKCPLPTFFRMGYLKGNVSFYREVCFVDHSEFFWSLGYQSGMKI